MRSRTVDPVARLKLMFALTSHGGCMSAAVSGSLAPGMEGTEDDM